MTIVQLKSERATEIIIGMAANNAETLAAIVDRLENGADQEQARLKLARAALKLRRDLDREAD